MNSVNRFFGQPEYFEIDGIGKVPLLPLRPKDLILFNDDSNPEERLKSNIEIIKRCCAESKVNDKGEIERIPFFTSEEIDEIPFEIFNKIINRLVEISGLKANEQQLRRIRETQTKNIQQKEQ